MTPADPIDEFLVGVQATIAKHGHAVIGTPGFSYTVGCYSDQNYHSREGFIMGMPVETAQWILNDLAPVLRGETPQGVTLTAANGWLEVRGILQHDVPLRLRIQKGLPVYVARRIAGKQAVPTALVQWPDLQGRWPDEPGCTVAAVQRLPDYM